MSEPGEYTYYTGFENEFKIITKKIGKKTYFNQKYKKEIDQFEKENSKFLKEFQYESSEEENAEYNSEDDDDFDNINQKNKKIKIEKFKKIKKEHLFYYLINQRTDDEKKYDCNIIIFDKDLINWLSEIEEIEIDVCYINGVKIPNCIELDDVFSFINDFRMKMNEYKNPKFKLFVEYVETIFKKDYSRMDKMIDNGIIDFNSLWYYFDKSGSYYMIDFLDKEICFNYNSFCFSKDFGVNKLNLEGTIILCNKSGDLNKVTLNHTISYFPNKRSLESFKIRILKEEEKEELIKNSEIMLKMIKNIKQMHLDGKQYVEYKDEGMIGIERNERVMVDNTNNKIEKLLPKSISLWSNINFRKVDLNDNLLIFPFLPVFNLGCGKVWGLVHYSDLKEINYQNENFDKIVMDYDKKNIIKKLTENYDFKKTNNLIDGKGSNLVFLFHGPPGVGKTLTAEATSDLLKKPLYQINIGDLELEPSKLEHNLKEIGKLCHRWDAVLLIDEADIFLESRNFSDIIRNTIVAIFLKFLEYSKNIIFLTTNRLETLDMAVRSRINLMITYPKLSENYRYQIWDNSLKNIDINNKKKMLDKLSKIELNGREINNIMNIVISMLQNEDYTESNFMNILNKYLEINNESNFDYKKDHLYI